MKIVPAGLQDIPLDGQLGRDCSACDGHRDDGKFLRCPNCGRLLEMGVKDDIEKAKREMSGLTREELMEANTRIIDATEKTVELLHGYAMAIVRINDEMSTPTNAKMKVVIDDVEQNLSMAQMAVQVKALNFTNGDLRKQNKVLINQVEQLRDHINRIVMVATDESFRIAT